MQDNDPQRIVEAEEFVWRDLAPSLPLSAAQRWTRIITTHPAVVAEFGHIHPEVQPLDPEKTDRIAESVKGQEIIRFSPEGCTLRAIMHELSHQYAYVMDPDQPDHGPMWVATTLRLHSIFMGPPFAQRLRRRYEKWDISIGRL